MENKHTQYDLVQMQSLSLDSKIRMSEQRIKAFYEHFDGQVYISFSGGKDSTVLIHLVRNLFPDVEGIFIDTGLEFPELREHVKSFEHITWIKPEKNFKQVILEEGYPVISKQTAQIIKEARIGLAKGDGSYQYRIDKLNGTLKDPKTGKRSQFNCEKWKFMLDAPFKISDDCCKIMKKKPAKQFEKMSGKKPILGTMACESRNRYQTWLKYGCNAFEKNRISSNPLSFWTEQDILEYIQRFNLAIPSIYGDIIKTGKQIERIDGFHDELTTSGMKRTGCMYCAFGCHLHKDNQFTQLREINPNVHNYCMKPIEEGGLGMKDVFDWMNEHGNMNIQY